MKTLTKKDFIITKIDEQSTIFYNMLTGEFSLNSAKELTPKVIQQKIYEHLKKLLKRNRYYPIEYLEQKMIIQDYEYKFSSNKKETNKIVKELKEYKEEKDIHINKINQLLINKLFGTKTKIYHFKDYIKLPQNLNSLEEWEDTCVWMTSLSKNETNLPVEIEVDDVNYWEDHGY